jgi:putative hydrolases of HD superfamily
MPRMNEPDLRAALQFVQSAEQLKTVLRSGHASNGRPESTAEHTWRLCLLAMVLERDLSGIDFAKLLKICVIHDLGEAIGGDIPATQQDPSQNKAQQERADLLQLLSPLAPERQADFLALWDEYNAAQTPEARMAKGLDKIETIIQHNQGKNPPDFDYAFNLGYGQKHTATHPLLRLLRQMVDADTQQHANQQVPQQAR